MFDRHAVSQMRALFAPIHKDGYKFVAGAAAVTFVACLISNWLGFLGLIVTLSLVFFFRDPSRVVPTQEGLVLAPADGAVISLGAVVPPTGLGLGPDPLTRVSIFLSVFDVHVIRTPVSGRIEKTFYKPGLHLNAGAPEASAENESFGFTVHMRDDRAAGTVLVAGAVARRIVPTACEGEFIMGGDRVGIIRFGSRVDIYLPAGTALLVAEGQRTIAGETVIADFNLHSDARLFKRI